MATELQYIGKIIGDRGTDGPKGYGWAYGSGAPSSSSTEIGPYNNSPANLYLDISTGDIYRFDESTSTWKNDGNYSICGEDGDKGLSTHISFEYKYGGLYANIEYK